MIDGRQIKAGVVTTVVGAVLGWAASGLAVVGRVDAIEKTLARIETRMDSFSTARVGK